MGQFLRHTVGNATLVALQDSWAPMQPGSFFRSVENDAWEPYRDLLEDDGSFVLNIGAWLVHSEGRIILVDTGIGSRPVQMPLQEPPALPAVLEAAGVAAADVDTVLLSHLHFDHTGWNTNTEETPPAPRFANARHLVQQAEWDHWTADESSRQAAAYEDLLAPLETANLLDLLEGERAITSELVAIPTPGHTPGHMSFVLASGGERAYLLGDVAHHPAQLAETDWAPSADVDANQSARTRAALFDRIEEEQALIRQRPLPVPRSRPCRASCRPPPVPADRIWRLTARPPCWTLVVRTRARMACTPNPHDRERVQPRSGRRPGVGGRRAPLDRPQLRPARSAPVRRRVVSGVEDVARRYHGVDEQPSGAARRSVLPRR